MLSGALLAREAKAKGRKALHEVIVPTAVKANDDQGHCHAPFGGTLNYYYRRGGVM
jgi:hypothetical protein